MAILIFVDILLVKLVVLLFLCSVILISSFIPDENFDRTMFLSLDLLFQSLSFV